MKFDKVEPKEKWSKQRTYQRISQTKRDVTNLNRKMNKLDGIINLAKSNKDAIRRRISNKNKYLKQLEKQLKEVI